MVPARPGAAAARHQRRVAVQDRAVAAVAEGAQQPRFFGRGIAEQGQRLIGMGRQHDMIEAARLAIRSLDTDRVLETRHLSHGVAQYDVAAERIAQTLDIAAAAAIDRAPDRAIGQLQQAVVVMEADEGGCGVLQHLVAGGRPDRGRHRKEMILPKRLAVAACVEIIAQRLAGERRGLCVPRRLGIEAAEIAQHRPEARAEQIAPLREEAREAGAAVFQASLVERDGEGHFRRLGRDAEMGHQRREIGVGRLVIDDEAGVDRHIRAAVLHDIDRVGMPAEPRRAFVQRDVMSLRQQPGAGEP